MLASRLRPRTIIQTLATLSAMGFKQADHVSAAIRGWHHGRIRAMRSQRARELLTKDGQTLNSDLVVHTTLEPEVEEAARSAAVHIIAKKGHKVRASEAAVIVMKPDAWLACTSTVPSDWPPASTNTGSAKPCTSIRRLHAESDVIE